MRKNTITFHDDDLVISGGKITIEAAAADKPGQRKIEIVAYTGGELHLPTWEYPVVVDLAGMGGTDRSRPILKDHKRELVVGHSTRISNDGRQVVVAGLASGTGPAAKEVLSTNDNGFPWQASVGVKPLAKEFVPAGRTATANGRTFQGPLIIARKSRFQEVSFVVLGADDDTSARIAARAAGDFSMTFEQWLASKSIAADGLSDAVKDVVKAQYEAEIAAAADDTDGDDDKPGKGQGKTKPKGKPKKAAGTIDASEGDDTIVASDGDDDLVAEQRKRLVADRKRITALAKVEAQFAKRVPAEKLAEISAKAIEEDWDADKLELNLIRAERPQSRGDRGSNGDGAKADARIIEAALSLSAGLSENTVGDSIATADRERVMNQAVSSGMRGYSLHALMDAVIHAAGMHYAGSRKTNDYIRAALQAEQMIHASGFSTLSLSGVLANVANKGLIAAYTAVEVVWNQIAAIRSHGDFKVHTRYRLDSTGAFKKVGPGGELKHISLTDSSFTNQVDTFGAIIALTRQMQINDDLGAFMEIPTLLGRLAALRVEEVVFVLLLSNPGSFFSAGNGNLKTGGGSALSIAGITASEQAFRDQVSDGKPVLISPTKLLVGTALKVDADNIFAEKLLITGENATKPARNPHAGKYPPFASPYINNTAVKDQDGAAITGQSATKWWQFADPAVRAAMGVAFLNGQQTPTIESAQTDFSTLGMQWRAYQDFGVGMEDPKAAIQNNGA